MRFDSPPKGKRSDLSGIRIGPRRSSGKRSSAPRRRGNPSVWRLISGRYRTAWGKTFRLWDRGAWLICHALFCVQNSVPCRRMRRHGTLFWTQKSAWQISHAPLSHNLKVFPQAVRYLPEIRRHTLGLPLRRGAELRFPELRRGPILMPERSLRFPFGGESNRTLPAPSSDHILLYPQYMCLQRKSQPLFFPGTAAGATA